MSIQPRILAVMLLLVGSAHHVAVSGETREALTGFRPKADFFQVLNVGVQQRGWHGACLGIAESAVTHWESVKNNPSQTVRLRDLGEAIKSSRAGGDEFLRQINGFAQNHSYSTLPTNSRSTDKLAGMVLDEMKQTKKPQVLGIDLPEGKRHAVVVWDAYVTTSDTIALRVGDPNHPDMNNLYLVYDPRNNDWKGLNFPKNAVIQGSFTPVFARWDEANNRPGDIPKKQTFEAMFGRVGDAVNDKSLTAAAIGNELQLKAPLAYDPSEHATVPLPNGSQVKKHKIIGTWRMVGNYSQEIWTFGADGTFTSDAKAAGSGRWSSTGDDSVAANIVYSYTNPAGVLKVSSSYLITIAGNKASVEFRHTARGGETYNSQGKLSLQRQN